MNVGVLFNLLLTMIFIGTFSLINCSTASLLNLGFVNFFAPHSDIYMLVKVLSDPLERNKKCVCFHLFPFFCATVLSFIALFLTIISDVLLPVVAQNGQQLRQGLSLWTLQQVRPPQASPVSWRMMEAY